MTSGPFPELRLILNQHDVWIIWLQSEISLSLIDADFKPILKLYRGYYDITKILVTTVKS